MLQALRTIVVTAAATAGLVVSAPGAVAATAPPGYQRVQTTLPLPPGQLDTGATIQCPTGTVPWGGGVAFSGGLPSAGENINTSEPMSTGWEARFNNATSAQGQFRIDAVCARKPLGYTIAFKTVDNPAGTQVRATAVCPVNTVLLDGGTLSTADTVEAYLLSAWPRSSTTYRAWMWNGTATDESFTAWAICAARPPGYRIVSATGTGIPGPVDETGGAQCPTTTALIGGGVKVSPVASTESLAASLDEPATQWLYEVVNTATTAVTVSVYAICAA